MKAVSSLCTVLQSGPKLQSWGGALLQFILNSCSNAKENTVICWWKSESVSFKVWMVVSLLSVDPMKAFYAKQKLSKILNLGIMKLIPYWSKSANEILKSIVLPLSSIGS